jgi:hypothetical protein
MVHLRKTLRMGLNNHDISKSDYDSTDINEGQMDGAVMNELTENL